MTPITRSSLAAIAALSVLAVPAGAATKPAVKPLKAPSFTVKLLTTNPVSVLQTGRLEARITATNTASVRVSAYGAENGKTVDLAPAKTYRIRAKKAKKQTLRFTLSAQGRRALAVCIDTRITFVVKARGYGSPKLVTKRPTITRERRVTFGCKNGKLVPISGSSGEPGGRPANPGTTTTTTTTTGGGSTGGGSTGGGTSGGSTGGGTTPAARTYSVGVGKQSLTSALNPNGTFGSGNQKVYLGGYGFAGGEIGAQGSGVQAPGFEGRSATGVLEHGSFVRSFATSDGTSTLVIANLEVQGWFASQKEADLGLVDMRKRAAAASGGTLKASQIFVQSDHSHSGVDAMGVWGGTPKAYREFMRDQAVKSILEANNRRVPGKLFYGTASGVDIISNQYRDDPANQPMDSDVRILQARDDAGKTLATLLNFSAHTTVLGADNTKISGDWVSAANVQLEDAFGGDAVTMIGTFGRSQPGRSLPCPGDDSTPAVAACKINSYAGAVVDRAKLAAQAATPLPADPKVVAQSYLITDPTTNGAILGFEVGGDAIGAPFNRDLKPPWQTGNVIGTITASARIGDVLISSMPGEAYPQIPLKVKDVAKGLRGYMTAGLSNDQLGYLIAPLEAYPGPFQRNLFSRGIYDGDDITTCVTGPSADTCPIPEPLSNDNYFFNVSHTIGERITCSLLRGAGEVFGKGSVHRDAYDRCVAFANDIVLAPGSDISPAPGSP